MPTVHTADPIERLLTPAEAAALFRVDPKTVTRWAEAGKLSVVRTLGGHRRFRKSEIDAALLRGLTAALPSSGRPARSREVGAAIAARRPLR